MAFWKEHDFWKYETFEPDVEPEILPGFEDLVRLWQDKRGDRPVPAWSDFDFHDFVGWHGWLTMSEAIYDPFDYRYRLFGVNIAEQLRGDFTGKLGSELMGTSEETAVDMEFYEMAYRQMLITRVSGNLHRFDRQHVSATFVEFPLSDSGDRATHLVEAMILD